MAATSIPLPANPGSRSVRSLVVVAMATWLALVVWLGASGVFVGAPGAPPLAIGIAVGGPLLFFWLWMRLSSSFRAFVLSLDLRLITGMQAWRWAGFGFLSLYVHGLLPAVFAFPAGLGDMAVGMTAPWIVMALLRRPGFATSKAFARWNLLGMLDLAVAVGIGTLDTVLATGAPGEVNTGAMAMMPLILIPGFLVPLFFMLHIAALLRRKHLLETRV